MTTLHVPLSFFFFFNDTATPEISTLPLHDALPILLVRRPSPVPFLAYMGVRYLLTRHHEELFPPWEPAWNGQGGKLWRNPEALPLFFVPASWRPARDPRDALFTTVANEDFSAAAVAEIPKAAGVEVRLVGSAGSPLGETDITLRRQSGQVRLRAVHPNGFELEVPGGGPPRLPSSHPAAAALPQLP